MNAMKTIHANFGTYTVFERYNELASAMLHKEFKLINPVS